MTSPTSSALMWVRTNTTFSFDIAKRYAAFYAIAYPNNEEPHSVIFWRWIQHEIHPKDCV